MNILSMSPSPLSSSTILSDHTTSSRAVETSILLLEDLDSLDLEKKLEDVSAETIEDKSKGTYRHQELFLCDKACPPMSESQSVDCLAIEKVWE